ncbi:hypothetical protein E4K10_18260 [Streptomyces sp. T1317-0309]|nr:hypothetical protein E4K10_18260 [Streptomyces sp. T1317-0309]
MLIGKWGISGNRSWHLRLENGFLIFHITTDGTIGQSVRAVVPSLPRRAAVRAIFTGNNGAGGSDWTFFWAPALEGPWEQIVTTTVKQTYSIYQSTAPLTIAPQQLDSGITVLRYPVTGLVTRVEVRSSGNGTIIAAPTSQSRRRASRRFRTRPAVCGPSPPRRSSRTGERASRARCRSGRRSGRRTTRTRGRRLKPPGYCADSAKGHARSRRR